MKNASPKFLTFDIEDWFNVFYAPELNGQIERWSDFESRVELATDLIIECCNKLEVRGTCFVLGWVAKKHPKVVQKLKKNGFEIASHGITHQSFMGQDEKFYRKELFESKNLLEDMIGASVKGFRAPSFTISLKNKLFFKLLAEAGYEFDSSIFCGRRTLGGEEENFLEPFEIFTPNGVIKEFPIVSDLKRPSLSLIGGGYFRLAPSWVISSILRSKRYKMLYYHPRDFDVGQPRIAGLSLKNSFRAYYGVASTKEKFLKLNSKIFAGNISEWL